MAFPEARVFYDGQGYAFNTAFVTSTASGPIEVVASATGRIRVLNYLLSADASNTMQWRSSASGISGDLFVGAGGGIAKDAPEGGFVLQTATGEALNIFKASTGRFSAEVGYVRL